MRNLSKQEVEATHGGLLKAVAEIAGIICGGVLADMGAGAVFAGLVGYGVTSSMEYNASNPAAAAAITSAYTSGAAI